MYVYESAAKFAQKTSLICIRYRMKTDLLNINVFNYPFVKSFIWKRLKQEIKLVQTHRKAYGRLLAKGIV